jgi:hypothetical protein
LGQTGRAGNSDAAHVSLFALQAVAGNAAVAELLGHPHGTSRGAAGLRRGVHPALRSTFVQRDPDTSGPVDAKAFRGDGAHKPTDSKYAAAIGNADAARLRKEGSLSVEFRRELNGKLDYFQEPAYSVYVGRVKRALLEVTRGGAGMSENKPDGAPNEEPFTDAQLERMGQAIEVNGVFQDIADLKTKRINTWAETAKKRESKPLREALDIVVAMVALGMGGVVGEVIAQGIKGKLLNEFVLLAGLEFVDKVAEDAYEYAMTSTSEALKDGVTIASNNRTASKVALEQTAADKDDMVSVYAEAVSLQAGIEKTEQREQFNLNAKGTYRKGALQLKRVCLKAIYNELLNKPELFQRELTEGFIRLMDEDRLARRAKKYGGDKKRTWQEDSSLHDTEERKGNLLVLPFPVSSSVGRYYRPKLDFPSFYALGTGANTRTLNKLANTAVKDLPLTLGFRYWVENPFYRLIEGGDLRKAWFTRDPSGHVWLEDGLGTPAMEWLASFYSGIQRELTDDERERYAPLGAQKLYDATKDKKITSVQNSDML